VPRIYCDANSNTIAYVIDGGGIGLNDYTRLPSGYTSMQAAYLAVIYSLNEFFLKWNKELDARQYDGLGNELTKVPIPSVHTKRPLPPPILVCIGDEVVVKQLSRQYHIGNDKLRKLAQQAWKMTENLDVKYMWVSHSENLARKILK